MTSRPTLYTSLLLLVLAVSLSQPIARGDYNISVQDSGFKVVWKINSWQNLTGFQGVSGTVFPANISVSLGGNDLSSFTSSLQQAVKARSNSATVDQASVTIKSTRPTYSCSTTISCPLQWLNVTVQFQVHVNPTTLAGESGYDMSWKTFRLDQDFQAGGIGFNRIGEDYLLQALVPFVNFQSGLGRSMSVFIGRLSVSNITYQAPTRNIVVLDASFLQTPLAKWNVTQDVTSATETWLSPDAGGFSVIGALRFTEQGSVAAFNYMAKTQFSAQLSTPIGASAKGDTLLVDTSGSLWDKISLSVIVASIGTLIGTVIVERRVVADTWTRRKNRKR